jgi:hypothetical protein
MNAPELLTRGLGRSDPAALTAQDTAQCLQALVDGAFADSVGSLLWWGGDLAGLLTGLRCPAGVQVCVATADAKQLRRAAQHLAGQSVRLVRLLHPQDLRQDAGVVQEALQRAPVRDLDHYLALKEDLAHRVEQSPAVAGDSQDLLVLDFALNRHRPGGSGGVLDMLHEALRTLKRGGQLLCPVLVADEPVAGRHTVRGLPGSPPLLLPDEAACWAAFESAGFHGITLHAAGGMKPLDRIEGADVRLMLVQAFKGKQGPCWELGQAVVYRGPWREVRDDDGHTYPRGVRVAVCAKTYELMHARPYAGQFLGLTALHEPALDQALPFDCQTPAVRHPRVTKGLEPFAGEVSPMQACGPGTGCC